MDTYGIPVKKCLSDIVQSRELQNKQQFIWLGRKKIVLFGEHEDPERSQTRVIFQKDTISHSSVLLIRFVQWIYGVLESDFTVTLCNPNEIYQRDLFRYKNPPILSNPVFVTLEDFDEIANLLQVIHKIQKKHYQKQVDDLLSILPPS